MRHSLHKSTSAVKGNVHITARQWTANITLPYVNLVAFIRKIHAPSGRLSLLLPAQHTQTIPGAAQGLHPSREESSSSLLDWTWDMWQSLHWTDWPDTQPLAERTKESLAVRKPSTISYSTACHARDAHDRLGGGTGCGQSSTLHIHWCTLGTSGQGGTIYIEM